MKRALALVAAASLLTACTTAPKDGERSIEGTTWSVTDIYLTPGEPSTLPQTSGGAVTFLFGETTATGNTGCAPLQAAISLADDDTELSFDQIKYDQPAADCPAPSLQVHDQITQLIHPGSHFRIDRRGPEEIVLTQESEALDAPSIRLLAT